MIKNIQMEYLLAIAKHKNITKAAEELHISQPSLSNQIIGLEKEIGKMKQADVAKSFDKWIADAEMVGDILLVSQIIETDDKDTVLNTAESLRNRNELYK